MKRILMFMLCLMVPCCAMATLDYQSEVYKERVCDMVGSAASLQNQFSHAGAKTKVENEVIKRSPGHPALECVMVPAVKYARENYKAYNQKDAYMKAWAYCMDRIEHCAAKYAR